MSHRLTAKQLLPGTAAEGEGQGFAHIISTTIGDMARKACCPHFMVEETEAPLGY